MDLSLTVFCEVGWCPISWGSLLWAGALCTGRPARYLFIYPNNHYLLLDSQGGIIISETLHACKDP